MPAAAGLSEQPVECHACIQHSRLPRPYLAQQAKSLDNRLKDGTYCVALATHRQYVRALFTAGCFYCWTAAQMLKDRIISHYVSLQQCKKGAGQQVVNWHVKTGAMLGAVHAQQGLTNQPRHRNHAVSEVWLEPPGCSCLVCLRRCTRWTKSFICLTSMP